MEWHQLTGEAFGLFCGRNPDHSWISGGEQFPLCQRCAGIYAGAALAVVLDLLLRPRRGRLFLALHGALIAQIAPLGLGLLENGAFLRSLSGWLFGLGLVGVLRWAAAPAAPAEPERARTAFYFAGAALGAAAVPLAGGGGPVAARLLAFWDLLGILALLALVGACPKYPLRAPRPSERADRGILRCPSGGRDSKSASPEERRRGDLTESIVEEARRSKASSQPAECRNGVLG